jgi:hypothetical protein
MNTNILKIFPTLCSGLISLTWQSKLSSPKAADNGIHEYFLMATYKENVNQHARQSNNT